MSSGDVYARETVDIKRLATTPINSAADFLGALDLTRWVGAFEENAIDLQTLFYVKDRDLAGLGMEVWERIKLFVR